MAAQLPRNLRSRRERVVLRGNGTDTHAGIESDECLRAVRKCDSNRIPGAHPGLVQDTRGLQYLSTNL